MDHTLVLQYWRECVAWERFKARIFAMEVGHLLIPKSDETAPDAPTKVRGNSGKVYDYVEPDEMLALLGNAVQTRG